MSCSTCGHTLDLIGHLGLDPGQGAIHHCGRCGTLVVHNAAFEDSVYVPKLVERVRLFREKSRAGVVFDRLWHQVGIAEAITPPAERPPEGGPT